VTAAPADAMPPWYAKGLAFQCGQCGGCCEGPGFVWVTPEEVVAIAAHVGLSTDEFARRHVRRIGPRLSLREKADFTCEFWNAGCSIYAARPRQCRTFPFWSTYLESEATWEKVRARCPGVGRGPTYDAVAIAALAGGAGSTQSSAPRGGCCGSGE